jgi:integrase
MGKAVEQNLQRKRRGRGEGSIEQLADGRWKGWQSLGKRPDGSRRRTAVYGRTKGEVLAKLRDNLGAAQRGTLADPGKVTTGEWLTGWLELKKPNLADTSHEQYKQHVDIHLAPVVGAVPLGKLRPPQVAETYRTLSAGGVSPALLAKVAATLRAALKSAVQMGLIAVNPALAVEKPRGGPKAEMAVWSPDELCLFRQAVRGDKLESLYLVAIDTGARQGELLALAWECLDLEAGTARIVRSLQERSGVHKLKETKNKSSRRVVRLSPETVKSLADLRDRTITAGFYKSDGPVFADRKGGWLRKSNLRNRGFLPAIKRSGLKPIRFHDLRHSAATNWLLGGANIKAVSRRLGHADPHITLTVYSHYLPEMDDRIIELSQKTLAENGNQTATSTKRPLEDQPIK